MSRRKEKFDALSQLLGCYFHQDWGYEFATSGQAVEAMVKEASLDQITKGIDEIDSLLRNNDDQLENIVLNEMGCYFNPLEEGCSYKEWLRMVRGKLCEAKIIINR
jgi:hypothetical protein